MYLLVLIPLSDLKALALLLDTSSHQGSSCTPHRGDRERDAGDRVMIKQSDAERRKARYNTEHIQKAKKPGFNSEKLRKLRKLRKLIKTILKTLKTNKNSENPENSEKSEWFSEFSEFSEFS